MVGRARELVAIDRALHAAAAGHGGLLLVSGEAGIGKSRLLAECARRARGMGMAVLSGRAVPHTGPFRAVAEALVPVAPPALAADPRLLVYRSALGQLLPGWPVDAVADRRLVDPVVLLGEAVLELLGVVATPVGGSRHPRRSALGRPGHHRAAGLLGRQARRRTPGDQPPPGPPLGGVDHGRSARSGTCRPRTRGRSLHRRS